MTSLKNSTLTTFLEDGAIIAHTEKSCLIWLGAFHPSSSSDYSFAYLPFFSKDICFFKSPHSPIEILRSDLINSLKDFIHNTPLTKRSEFNDPDHDSFTQSMSNIQDRIQKKEIHKAVNTTFTKAYKSPDTQERAYWLYHLLTNEHTNLTPYGFWRKGYGILGSTPEILFRKKDDTIHTMALAGTYPKSSKNERPWLLEDEKELAEHQFVVNDIEERLSPWGDVKKSETKILELPSMYHLVTHFQLRSNQLTETKLIHALHPTPALGVSPRSYGYEWLKPFSLDTRYEIFGAPLLFRLGESETLCVVAIRNIQWTDNEIVIGSGAGIVQDSQTEREWDELKVKRDSVFSTLGIE